MSSRRLRLTLGKLAGAGLIAAVAVGMAAPPAFADTSTATANAATASILGGTLLTTGGCSSSNSGPPMATQSCGESPATSLLTGVTAIAAGLLVQDTSAFNTGISAACAGLVGSGGTIQIGDSGVCTVTGANPGGVTVNLGTLAVVKADAILAECVANSKGTNTASVQLVNATISILGGSATPIISSPAANDNVVNLAGLAMLTLNKQPAETPAPPAGSVSTQALDLTLVGTGTKALLHLTVGTVSCGPNAVTPASPAFPLEGAPIAAGIFLVAGYIGYRYWWLPRRRVSTLA